MSLSQHRDETIGPEGGGGHRVKGGLEGRGHRGECATIGPAGRSGEGGREEGGGGGGGVGCALGDGEVGRLWREPREGKGLDPLCSGHGSGGWREYEGCRLSLAL